MKAKRVFKEVRVNYGYKKGNNDPHNPDYMVRKPQSLPWRLEMSRARSTFPILTLILK